MSSSCEAVVEDIWFMRHPTASPNRSTERPAGRAEDCLANKHRPASTGPQTSPSSAESDGFQRNPAPLLLRSHDPLLGYHQATVSDDSWNALLLKKQGIFFCALLISYIFGTKEACFSSRHQEVERARSKEFIIHTYIQTIKYTSTSLTLHWYSNLMVTGPAAHVRVRAGQKPLENEE